MNKTIVALYDDFNSATNAVKDLVYNGFSRDNISLMSADSSGEYSRELNVQNIPTETAQGTGVGVGIGAVLGGIGGLLVGLGALAIPGIGPVLAGGPLASALSAIAGAGIGAAAGGLTGGLIGALVDMGIPEDTAHYYAEGVRRGGTLVTLNTSDERANEATRIMNLHNPVDVNERATSWRETGWSGFDETVHETPPRVQAEMKGERMDEMESAASSTWPNPTYRTGGGQGDFENYEPSFRSHFASSVYHDHYPYEQFQPAYRYGYSLARDERYRGRTWEDIEPEAQRYWEEKEPGVWERFKNSVRYAWEEMKEAVR